MDIPHNNPKLKTLESRSRDINEEYTTIQELGGTKLTPFENIDGIFARNISNNIRIIVQPPATTGECLLMIYLSNKNGFFVGLSLRSTATGEF